MNLVTRPGGGWFSDKVGRKRSILILTTGVMLSYGLMTQIGPKWPLAGTMAAAILSSIFLQAGNGACFAIVPLIRKDLTGKLAGLVGAYGNFGAVVFLIVFSFVDTKLFFTILASYSALILAVSAILRPFTMDSENRGDN